jgi:hypothetical protein
MTLRSDLLEPQYSYRGPVQNPLYREGDGYSSEEQEQARSNPSYMLTPNPRTSMAFPALARDSFINQAAGFAVSGIPSQELPEQWTPRVPGERRLSEPGFPPFRGRATSEGPLASHRSESEAPHFGVSPFEVRRSQRGPRPPTLDLSALEGMSGRNPLTRSGQVDRPSQRERSNDPYFEPSSSHVSEGLARGGGISGFVKRAERMRSNNIGRTFERVGSAPLIRIGPASATQAGGNDGVANRRGGAPSLTGGGEGGGAVRMVTPPLVQIGMSLVLGSLQVEEAVALRMEGVALQVEEGVVHQVEEAFLHLVVVVGAVLAVEVAHQVVVADGVVVQVADVVYLLEAPPE